MKLLELDNMIILFPLNIFTKDKPFQFLIWRFRFCRWIVKDNLNQESISKHTLIGFKGLFNYRKSKEIK